MKYRRLVDDDYSFGKGNQDFVTDAEAVSQAIKTRLKLLQGEWWENIEEGLPLFQSILGQPGTPENIKSAELLIQDVIINTPDVTGIESFESSCSNRIYTINCTVSTKYGTVTLEVRF